MQMLNQVLFMISATIKFYLLTVKTINIKMGDYDVECLMWFTVVVQLLNVFIVCFSFILSCLHLFQKVLSIL